MQHVSRSRAGPCLGPYMAAVLVPGRKLPPRFSLNNACFPPDSLVTPVFSWWLCSRIRRRQKL